MYVDVQKTGFLRKLLQRQWGFYVFGRREKNVHLASWYHTHVAGFIATVLVSYPWVARMNHPRSAFPGSAFQ